MHSGVDNLITTPVGYSNELKRVLKISDSDAGLKVEKSMILDRSDRLEIGR